MKPEDTMPEPHTYALEALDKYLMAQEMLRHCLKVLKARVSGKEHGKDDREMGTWASTQLIFKFSTQER